MKLLGPEQFDAFLDGVTSLDRKLVLPLSSVSVFKAEFQLPTDWWLVIYYQDGNCAGLFGSVNHSIFPFPVVGASAVGKYTSN